MSEVILACTMGAAFIVVFCLGYLTGRWEHASDMKAYLDVLHEVIAARGIRLTTREGVDK